MTGAAALARIAAAISGYAARLKAAGEPLRRVLSFSLADDALAPAKTVCVAIEKGLLSVAYGSRLMSRITLRGCKVYPMEERYPTPDELSSSVRLAVSALNAPRTEVTLSIPKAWTVAKIAEFPSSVKESLPDVIAYEIDRITPFGQGEAYYDFRMVKEDQERITVLVVAVKTDLIAPYLDALRDHDFTVGKVTVDLSALGTFLHFTDGGSESVLVRVGEKDYEGAGFLGGSMTGVFTGSFRSGDAGERLDTVVAALQARTDEARAQGRSPRVIVSLKEKDRALREMMKLKAPAPLKILEESAPLPGLSTAEMSYEAVGGVIESLWPRASGVDLLGKGRLLKEKTPFAFTAVLVVVLIVMCSLYLVAPVKIEGGRLAEIDRQISMRREEIKKIEALKKDVAGLESEARSIANFKADKPMVLSILKELTAVLPKSAWITRARVTETTVDIEGYAASATELIPKLEASPYFKKTEFASPTFRDARMNADRFSIKMEIKSAKKAEVEKPAAGEKPKSEKK